MQLQRQVIETANIIKHMSERVDDARRDLEEALAGSEEVLTPNECQRLRAAVDALRSLSEDMFERALTLAAM